MFLRILADLIHINLPLLSSHSSQKYESQSPRDLHISNSKQWLHHLKDRSRLTLSFFNSPSISISKVGYIALYWLANTLNLEDKNTLRFVLFVFFLSPPPTLQSTDNVFTVTWQLNNFKQTEKPKKLTATSCNRFHGDTPRYWKLLSKLALKDKNYLSENSSKSETRSHILRPLRAAFEEYTGPIPFLVVPKL